jgi:hypothetical protein
MMADFTPEATPMASQKRTFALAIQLKRWNLGIECLCNDGFTRQQCIDSMLKCLGLERNQQRSFARRRASAQTMPGTSKTLRKASGRDSGTFRFSTFYIAHTISLVCPTVIGSDDCRSFLGRRE